MPPSFAIIMMGKRELIALLSVPFCCLVIVVWLFLAVPWVCLQFVIVVFPDHTHLLFWSYKSQRKMFNNDFYRVLLKAVFCRTNPHTFETSSKSSKKIK